MEIARALHNQDLTKTMKSVNLLKPYLAENRVYIAAGFICLIGVDLLQLFLPRIIRQVIDDLTGFNTDLRGLSVYALYITGIALMIGIFRHGWLCCFIGMSRRMEEGLRNQFFGHIQTLSASYFGKMKTGDLMAHATNDMQQIRLAAGIGIVMIIDTVFLGTTAIAFMAFINVRLTLYALIPMPLIVLVSRFFGRKIHHISGEVQASFSNLTEIVRERFAGIRIIKAYNREPDSLAAFTTASQDYVSENLKLARISGSFSPMITFLSNLSLAMILYFGGTQTVVSEITPGEFVAFSSYLGLLTWPMTSIGSVTNTIQRGKASLDRIHAIMETSPEIADRPDACPVRTLKEHIVFENVSFFYPSDKSGEDSQVSAIPALSEIGIKVEPGMTLGIIGPPGAGKTALLGLIPRFYDVSQGRILIGGRDIRELRLHDLRSLISFMPQEPFLFAGTIRENITFSKDRSNDSELIKAAESANLYDTVKSFPDGFETVVGEKGVILSGGQKQRIALARALMRNSPVLLLDDPVSQVDAETGNSIIHTIRDIARTRTVVIVSHRISAVEFADQIITLKQGRITEYGSPAELMQDDTYYAKTFHIQKIEEELNAF